MTTMNREDVAKIVARRVYEVTNLDTGRTHLMTDAKARRFFGSAEWKEAKMGYGGNMVVSPSPLNAEQLYDAFERGEKLFGCDD